MIFNSLAFLLFFPLVTAGYFTVTMRLAPRNEKLANSISQILLLAASLFFYGYWNPAYLILMLISVAVTWASGFLMEGRSAREKRLILAASLVINLGILFFFKYYNFFIDSVRLLVPGNRYFPSFNVLLPVGISFYTFQALGYSIDIYYERVRAERNFITYALFVTFFPQLVAGPIERTGNLLPQFKVNHKFDYDRVTSGLRLAAWGMFKKVVIADRLAIYVNGVFGDPGAFPSTALALAVFFFAVQIYCDFSGYSDIAIGCARVLGFNLMSNFRQPYFSRSVAEFWRRWHISLSTWLKDYLYIPLGGSRKGEIRRMLNLFITFLISGLWHGAAWHFVAWGALHGLFQITGRTTAPFRNAVFRRIGLTEDSRPRKIMQICITFVLVCFAWIFFRANTIGDAFLIIAKLAELPGELIEYIHAIPRLGIVAVGQDAIRRIDGFEPTTLGLSILFIAVLFVADNLAGNTSKNIVGFAARHKVLPVIRWFGYYILVLTILMSWNIASAQFIYFTF